MRRLSLPLSIVIVLALGLGLLIGGTAPTSAVSVNGHITSQASVKAELNAITSNASYLCYMNDSELIRTQGASGLVSPWGATTASWSSGYVANWLNQDITNEIIHQAAQAKGLLPLSQADLLNAQTDLLGSMDATLNEAAGTEYACNGTATQILETMPTWFVRDQIVAQAESEALLVATGGIALDSNSVQAYYNTHTSDFDTYCLSAIELTDPTVYPKIQAGLAAGTSFGALAKQYSQDATSAANNGVLGCIDPTAASYSSVVQDAGKLTVGVPSGPILSGSNNSELILLVTSRTHTPLSKSGMEEIVRREMLAQDAANSSASAKHLITSAAVQVNPLYGHWSRSKALSGIVPPTVPPGSQLLNSIVITPGATGV